MTSLATNMLQIPSQVVYVPNDSKAEFNVTSVDLDLPPEVWMLAMKKLPIDTLKNVAATCHTWHDFAYEPGTALSLAKQEAESDCKSLRKLSETLKKYNIAFGNFKCSNAPLFDHAPQDLNKFKERKQLVTALTINAHEWTPHENGLLTTLAMPFANPRILDRLNSFSTSPCTSLELCQKALAFNELELVEAMLSRMEPEVFSKARASRLTITGDLKIQEGEVLFLQGGDCMKPFINSTLNMGLPMRKLKAGLWKGIFVRCEGTDVPPPGSSIPFKLGVLTKGFQRIMLTGMDFSFEVGRSKEIVIPLIPHPASNLDLS